MNAQVTVSVIIPCYNQGQFIDEAVDAVLAQTFRDFEIIIVNDGSTDPATNRLLQTFSRPRTTVLTTDNQGLAAARNNGIRQSQGRYILPLDADDRIAPTYLERAVALLDGQDDLGIVYCRARLFGAVEAQWDLPDFSLEQMLLDNLIFCSALFRRVDWEQVGGYDVSMRHGWEDYDFWLSLLAMERKVHCIPETLFFYRVSDGSMVRARPRKHKLVTFAAIFRKHQQLYADNIEIWVDKLLDAGAVYHEARLQIPERPADEPSLVRKVEIAENSLLFHLSSPDLDEPLLFFPAAEPVAFRIHDLFLETPVTGRVKLSFTHNADVAAEEGVHVFCGQDACLQLHPPAMPSTLDGDVQLGITVEYIAFGVDCLPVLFEQLTRVDASAGQLLSPDTRQTRVESQGFLAVNWALLKQKINAWRCYFRDRQYRLLYHSGLFDVDYYLQQDPSFPALLIDPLVHYVENGWREGRRANPLFEDDWYRKKYKVDPGRHALLHYIEEGWQADNQPHPYFDTSWYVRHYADSIKPGMNPLGDYCQGGWQAGRKPHPLFDPVFYATQYLGGAENGGIALEQYSQEGNMLVHDPSPFFDISFYLEDNPAVILSAQRPLIHYQRYGAEEGRTPHRLYDPVYYRSANGLEDLSALDLFVHFSEKGVQAGARPSALFDPSFYQKAYGNGMDRALTLRHYTKKGVFEGHYPCREVADLAEKPVISILTPVYNSDEKLLRRSIHSVLFQAYPHWQLCLVDDGSADNRVREILAEYAALDQRITVDFLQQNRGISEATNRAATLAVGEYLAFLDHDDELTIDALYHVVEAINNYDADVLYTDEELIDRESRYLESFFKPDFNQELLLCHNYITHFFVTRRTLFDQVGGLSDRCAGAQDYDLALKTTEQANCIHHIRKSLYRWRATETSTSVNHAQKEYADAAGRHALQLAVDRRGLQADVEPGKWKFYYSLARRVETTPEIAIIALWPASMADPVAWLEVLLAHTGYANFHVHFLGSESILQEVTEKMPNIQAGQVTCHVWPENRSEPAALNQVALAVHSEQLVFIRGGVVPQEADWLETMLGYSAAAECGVVGGHLLPEEQSESNPALPEMSDLSCRTFRRFLLDGSVHQSGLFCAQQVVAASFDFCMIKQQLLQDVGGFNAGEFVCCLYDVDCCLRLRKLGVEHVFTPSCSAIQPRGTRGWPDNDAARREKQHFQQRWQALLRNLPYYNEQSLLQNRAIAREDWQHWIAGTGDN